MERELKLCQVYRHFKGGLYIPVKEAEHTETGEVLVIYQSVETGKLWARPKDMFMSEIDHKKYPEVDQKYRFEQITSEDQV